MRKWIERRILHIVALFNGEVCPHRLYPATERGGFQCELVRYHAGLHRQKQRSWENDNE
jgi:hypothetical protein